MRNFDRPLAAEIFVGLVWVLFIAGVLGIKLPADLGLSHAWASVSSVKPAP